MTIMDSARRRLLFALAASALLHLWLAHTHDGSGARRAAAAVSTSPAPTSIRATLAMTPQALPQVPEAPQAVPHVSPPPAALPAQQADVAAAARAVVAMPTHTAIPPVQQPSLSVVGSSVESAAAAASDPTYYTARSLDVFPRALTALNLGVQDVAGRVRATVLIDESGAVNEVRTVEAADASAGHAARDLLFRTRFSPAQKDGRIVKAQLLVSLEPSVQAQP